VEGLSHPGLVCFAPLLCRVVREEILVMGESRNNNFSVSCLAYTQQPRRLVLHAPNSQGAQFCMHPTAKAPSSACTQAEPQGTAVWQLLVQSKAWEACSSVLWPPPPRPGV
jgi:hypothetical protein